VKVGRLKISPSNPLVLKEGTLYELGLKRLNLITNSGKIFSFPEALKNGRSSYVIFENLIRELTGFEKVKHFDHIDQKGKVYEQKSYKDPQIHQKSSPEFQCSSSNTFGANNYGPKIKRLLNKGDYPGALKLCKDLSYNEIDYFIFTNTSQWSPQIPLRFFAVSKTNVLKSLSKTDPRLVCRDRLMATVRRKTVLV
jgi:hypothetical protein